MEDDFNNLQRTRCNQCSRRPLSSHHMTLLLPLIMLLTSVCHAMCPTRCQCDDEVLRASCTTAGLSVVPIQLNPELKVVNLSHNKINNVHFTLNIYANLVQLDLSHNRIQKLGSLNFISQGHLETLDLSSNDLEGLEKDVFKGLKTLRRLDLSSNRIEDISTNSFSELVLLETLLLNNNKLVSFEQELFRHLVHLQTLQLDDNQLLEIPSDNLVYTTRLQHLSMSRNLVEYIEESSLPVLKQLTQLSLDTNVISEIHPTTFDAFISLEGLNLADNNLTQVPTSQLSKLANLVELNLSGNFFATIPPVAFRGLFKLQKLHLSGIETLQKIDVRAFVDNINLETIAMDDNIALEELPTRLFHGNPKLKEISIKNNLLQTLEASHFPLDQLVTLHMAQNPLDCNCSLMWLWKLVTEPSPTNLTEEMSLDTDGIKCATPLELQGTLLADLPESEIRCSPNWIAVATGSGTAFFVLTVICIAIVYSGVLKKCSGEKSYLRRANHDVGAYQTDQSASAAPRGRDKCEHMIGPPLLSEYQTLPPWEYPQNKDIDLYKQFGYHSNLGQGSRPHIVYV